MNFPLSMKTLYSSSCLCSRSLASSHLLFPASRLVRGHVHGCLGVGNHICILERWEKNKVLLVGLGRLSELQVLLNVEIVSIPVDLVGCFLLRI
jgi:hypothetical protein